MGRLFLPLLLLLLLAVVPAAQAQPGRILTVRDFGDAPPASGPREAGPVGSLRYLLLREAKPGDTIRFARAAVITLNGPLIIPQSLDALTIDGSVGQSHAALRYGGGRSGAGGNGVLSIRAAATTVKGLRIEGEIEVAGSSSFVRVTEARILDNEFAGASARLILRGTRGTLVQGNRFTGQSGGVDIALDQSVRILGNTFANDGKTAVDGIGSMVIERNTFTGSRVRVELNGGRVKGNRFFGGSLPPLQVIGGERPVTVGGNTFTLGSAPVRLLASDGLLTVTGNTISGRAGLNLLCTGNAGEGARVHAEGNTISGAAGILVSCDRDAPFVALGNRVVGSSGSGIIVRAGNPVQLSANTVTGSRQAGLLILGSARVSSRRDRIVGNSGPGVSVASDAQATIGSASMGANGGAGIVAPAGAPVPALTLDRKRNVIRGTACPGCSVQIYESESGDKAGNPGAGEGLRALATVKAKGDGTFVYPAQGRLRCPASGKVTATATSAQRGTSAFAPDAECACVVSEEFVVDVSRVPAQGFWNPGIQVSFLAGSTVTGSRLEDTRTDKRPSRGALGPTVRWTEFANRPPAADPGSKRFSRDFFVNVSDNRDDQVAPSGPKLRWRFVVEYEPPRGASDCGAVVSVTK